MSANGSWREPEPRRPRALMVQGATSGAGKSTLVAGLCRVLRRQGVSVAPFKPQNMALNSAVTVDGGEIGRAQALQALAAGLPPHTDMNPVLLKPSSDSEAQVIVQGRVRGTMDARAYHAYKPAAMEAVMESFHRLSRQFDVVVVEGAGSPAEINLREGDIANMGFALAARCPVVLVADIDRGGVFAHLVGTLELLSGPERALVRGFVINRFRGDRALLDPGLDWLESRTRKAVCGVVPYLHGLSLDAEDAIDEGQRRPAVGALKVAVPVYPRISNHTDFDALRARPDVDLRFVGPGKPIGPADLIVLGGSKNVRPDLEFVRLQGWDEQIRRHLRYGGRVVGLCGGMQMLGTAVCDPGGVEGLPGTTRGLDLLDFDTVLGPEKTLREVEGVLCLAGGAPVRGYEMHMGKSRGTALSSPAVKLSGVGDGAISEDGRILCTYVHGLFDGPRACAALLEWAGLRNAMRLDYAAERERSIERLADAVGEHVDVARLLGPGPDLPDKCGAVAPRPGTRQETPT